MHVVGVGLHPYQKPSETPYTALGVRAVQGALDDLVDEVKKVALSGFRSLVTVLTKRVAEVSLPSGANCLTV